MTWATGDIFGLRIPADAGALLDGGPGFLTDAFRACGSLDGDNRVTAIVASEEFVGGGTGKKLVATVAYQHPGPDLPEELFVKFSRNFDDELQDSGRSMMISEANVAVLSRTPDFPVPVPRCMFADVEEASATGLLITERISYGANGVEPLYPKCLDHLVPDAVEHYRAIVRGLARLSGAHRGGRLPAAFDERFPHDAATAGALGIYTPTETLVRWASRMFDFLERYPHLFPEHLHELGRREQFIADIPDVVAADGRIREVLASDGDMVAFAHWNANIDNCFFRRDEAGVLQCGFIDWANAGPTSVAQSIMGAISGAEHAIWRDHLDELLHVFADEYAAQGAPRLDPAELRRHILLMAAVSGLGFSMGAPVAIQREIDDLDALTGPRDDAFLGYENARIQLHMMMNLLENWQTFALGDVVRQL